MEHAFNMSCGNPGERCVLPADLEKVLILGAGVSGLAAASLLISRGCASVRIAGECRKQDAAERERLAKLGVVFYDCGIEPAADSFCCEVRESSTAAGHTCAVISPGIAFASPAVSRLKEESIRTIGELELGLSLLQSGVRVIAVTGSKGKSSLVKLISDTLRMAGKNAVSCGNYGLPVCKVAETGGFDYVAAECSSFQLESALCGIRADAAVLLNISPDHLDRHGDMNTYAGIKMRIFRNCPEDACFVNCGSSAGIVPKDSFFSLYGRRPVTFGTEPSADWRWNQGCVAGPKDLKIRVQGSYFDNRILGSAAAAGAAVLLSSGLSVSEIEAGFAGFIPLEHRMQPVCTKGNVTFIDDSKATSLEALAAGCSMAAGPIFLIAGGRLKEKPRAFRKEFVTSDVKKVYLIGESSSELAGLWKNDLPVAVCGTLERAVSEAYADAAVRGGTVLLSPGTASFDQFSSFAERGEQFVSLVRGL